MPSLDSTANAQIATGAFAPAWFIWLDIIGDPLRVTNFGDNVAFSSTGDSDLDGNTFTSFGGQFLDVGDVQNSDQGSDTLTITLSGILNLDQSLLNAIGNRTTWQGRSCRVWFRVYDEAGSSPQGAIVPHYTGYMSSVTLLPSPTSQTIQLTVENYLAAFNDASNRSYLNQQDYDSGDLSAAATIAASNGSVRGVGGSTPIVPVLSGGGVGVTGAGGTGGGTNIGADAGGGAYGGFAEGGFSRFNVKAD